MTGLPVIPLGRGVTLVRVTVVTDHPAAMVMEDERERLMETGSTGKREILHFQQNMTVQVFSDIHHRNERQTWFYIERHELYIF